MDKPGMENVRHLNNPLNRPNVFAAREGKAHHPPAFAHTSLGQPDMMRGARVRRHRPMVGATVIKCLAVAVVVLSSMAHSLPPELAMRLLKVSGGGLALGLIYQLTKRYSMPVEVKLYFAFLFWSLVSGMLVSTNLSLSVRVAWTVFQMGILFWAAAVAHQWQPDLRLVMTGIWASGVLYSLVAHASQAVGAISKETGGRMIVLGTNPNSAGQIFLFAIFAALYLWERTASRFVKLAMIGTIPVFSFFLLYTGSRKMLIGAILLIALWVLTMGKSGVGRGRKLFSKFLLVLAIAGAIAIAASLWEDSPMGRRFGTIESGFDGRASLYARSWALFLENPIAGVGLFNQTVVMYSQVHSDFMDVLVSTGLIGAVLYFSIYLVALRRAWKSGRFDRGLMRADRRYFWIYSAVIFWLMLGFSRYMDILHLAILGSFIGTFTPAGHPSCGPGGPQALPPSRISLCVEEPRREDCAR
jgi:O-antigen ligase